MVNIKVIFGPCKKLVYDGTDSGIKQIVTSVLAYEKVWGIDLNHVPLLTESVTNYLIKIENDGMQEAIKEVTNMNAHLGWLILGTVNLIIKTVFI